MKSIITLITLAIFSSLIYAEIPAVPKSISPDGKIYAVMDIDRDPSISPEWKEGSFPQIEITEKVTGKVIASISYFGAVGDDQRLLREHVEVLWRNDSTAFAINIHDRYYSSCEVYVQDEKMNFSSVDIPKLDYQKVTGFPEPDTKHLRPRGRSAVKGWDKEGQLIYSMFLSPLPTFKGNDPLKHLVYFKITPTEAKVTKVQSQKGEWKHGDWIPTRVEKESPLKPAVP